MRTERISVPVGIFDIAAVARCPLFGRSPPKGVLPVLATVCSFRGYLLLREVSGSETQRKVKKPPIEANRKDPAGCTVAFGLYRQIQTNMPAPAEQIMGRDRNPQGRVVGGRLTLECGLSGRLLTHCESLASRRLAQHARPALTTPRLLT
jgi:hypothetical protein